MLPPGHVAAGYLVSETALRAMHFKISNHQFQELVLWGAFFGFAPDFDFFIAFAKAHAFKIDLSKANHRKFPSHAPLLWLIAGAVIYFFAKTDFGRAFGVILWLSSWSHFILDSAWGIMWLWPFSTRLYPLPQKYYQDKILRAEAEEREENRKPFLNYWFDFAKNYYFGTLTGALEIIIIITALIYVSTISHR